MNTEELELYNSRKREQHKVYDAFIIVMMAIIVMIGAIGIIGYFTYNNIVSTIMSAAGIIIAILFMISKQMKDRIIYPIKMYQ